MMDFVKLMVAGWQNCAKLKLAKYQDKIRNVKWKNERAPKNEAYNPTPIEHVANILTHGVLVIPTFWLSKNLIESADTPQQYFSAVVYGLVLTGLFSVSTIFHTVAAFSTNSLWRNLFHRADRAMIYLFIAGSYTPWLQLKNFNGVSEELRWFIWVLSTLGILYQQLFHEKYKALETFFYVVIALLPSLAVFQMWSELRDYSPNMDYVVEPKYYTMPPLLRLYMEREMLRRETKTTEESFLLPHFKTYQVKDRDVLEDFDGKVEKYQETITRCEGTADYRYDDKISKDYAHGVGGSQEEQDKVVNNLPEEMPFPTPFVGMRLYKLPWSNIKRWNEEDPRPANT